MPSWMLRCPKCSFKFPHSTIASEALEQAHRDPFRVVARPAIPTEGEKRRCPSCKSESLFRPFELFYIEDRSTSA
jgi:DNA-directed RNA polymerase subunit RPC12/RpoP